MSKFKIGDKVRIKENHTGKYGIGGEYTITVVMSNGQYYDGEKGYGLGKFSDYDIELIESNNKINMSNIKEKFALMFKNDPEKSFRLSGITNGDDLLTDDGRNIFLSWLLRQNGKKFKEEVVDELLKKEE